MNSRHVTVATLPAASTQPDAIFMIVDSLTVGDFTVGGGTLCTMVWSNGGAWKVVSESLILGVTALTACSGNDSRLSDARAPSGSAGGDLTGTYPNPTVKASVSLTTPAIGAATGTSLATTGAITSSGAGIGYATGAGGTVSQSTSKSTGVTLNKLCGTITMNAAALAVATIVTFTVTNSTMGATDVVIAQHDSGGTIGAYTIRPNTSAAGSFKISIRNNTAGSLSEALVIRFAIVKAVAA